ncbi:hypothetical protein N0V88_002735 [Collariella sp. IMI 366227]|nr:hypothetical protein N0V88_002735 [Collariella sp. IMI 366227]
MKSFLLLPVALLAGAAVAQTTECGADYIVEACLASEKAKLAACKGDDYDCACARWIDIITCYNNCPNDPRIHESAGQRDIFCTYASQFPSNKPTIATSSVVPASKTSASNDAEKTDDTEKTGAEKADDAAATETTSGATPTKSPNAAPGGERRS